MRHLIKELDPMAFLATLDGKGHMVEDGMIAINLSHLIADDRIIAAAETWC